MRKLILGRLIAEYLDKFDEPIFDSSYEILHQKKYFLINLKKRKESISKKEYKVKKEKNTFGISPDLEN